MTQSEIVPVPMPTEEELKEGKAIEWVGARGEEIKLTLPSVRRLFAVPHATDEEVFTFLKLAQAQRLNPFLREIYIVKYQKDKPASYIVGKDAFVQRAEAHPDFDGFTAGVIVQRGDEILQEEGSFVLPTDKLLGGWFEGRRRGYSEVHVVRVALHEYHTGQSTWKQMPATMIRKVAIVQGLREMFAKEFTGMYDAAEMNITIAEDGTIIQEDSPGPISTRPRASAAPAPAKREGPSRPVGHAPASAAPTAENVIPEAVEWAGIEWIENQQYHSWSGRNSEGEFVKLGRHIQAICLNEFGWDDKQVNYELKKKFGVTASGLSPQQASEFIEFDGEAWVLSSNSTEALDMEHEANAEVVNGHTVTPAAQAPSDPANHAAVPVSPVEGQQTPLAEASGPTVADAEAQWEAEQAAIEQQMMGGSDET